jgi:hypothetical protein
MRLIRDGTLDRAGVGDLAERLGIAARTGFASLRRFDAVFAEAYKRTPTALRRLRFKPIRRP